jgi:hypothetical protein
MNYAYNPLWDRLFNVLMDKHKFEITGPYTARLGNCDVWIGNHPYASMRPYNNYNQFRPSRATIERAHKKLIIDTFEDKP